MLIDTEFPVKWVTYCIPFGVHVHTFLNTFILYQVTTVKVTY